jgi:glucose 1-dehydrogenase
VPTKILITGVSSGGIGEAICCRFPEASIFTSSQEAGNLPGDLTDPAFPEKLVHAAASFCGGLDLVVSNAGKSQHGLLNNLSLDGWDEAFNLHVRAAWLLAKAAYPHLRESHGSFIATGSVSGTEPHGRHGAYPVAKAALIALCRNLAVEWAPEVQVNTISPGLIKTGKSPKEWAEGVVPLGYPGDVADAVAFLSGNAFMTGHNIVIDGGLTAQGLTEMIP